MDGTSNKGPRGICETKQFEKEKKDLLSKKEYKRLDEIIGAMGVALGLNPERYPIAVENTNLREFTTRAFKTMPSYRIWYTFDDEYVDLLHIEINEEEE